MTETVINDIHSALRAGARLSVGRNYYGRIRLKLMSGPFKLVRKRMSISATDLQRLQSTIKLRSIAA
jgi:hypothetical protein